MSKKKQTEGKAAKKTVVEPPPDPRAPVAPTEANLSATLAELTAVLKGLTPPAQPQKVELVHALCHIVLGEGLPCGVGQECVRRIEAAFVDRNEFRVTEAFVVAELLGDLEIPDLFERCLVVRDAIAQIYNDQNAINLDFLHEAGVSDRQNFFNRVPSLSPKSVKFLMNLLSFEEAIFSDRSTQRVIQRLGLDPKASYVNGFFAALKTELAPFGHVPLQVGPDRGDGKPITKPILSPACLLARLAPRGKR